MRTLMYTYGKTQKHCTTARNNSIPRHNPVCLLLRGVFHAIAAHVYRHNRAIQACSIPRNQNLLRSALSEVSQRQLPSMETWEYKVRAELWDFFKAGRTAAMFSKGNTSEFSEIRQWIFQRSQTATDLAWHSVLNRNSCIANIYK